jgi:hypothetical protein
MSLSVTKFNINFTILLPQLHWLLLLLIPIFCACTAHRPFADIHLHYNWDQQELLSVDEAIAHLDTNNVSYGVVSSVPSHFALTLARRGKGKIIPLFSPYITVESRRTWFRDKNVLRLATLAIESGEYKGIGELHLWDGMNPQRDNAILVGLLRLAQQHDVPFLIHTESSRSNYFRQLCESYPKIRFLWAHAGGHLGAQEIETLMVDCPNVWIDLSARDPWRYDSLVKQGQKLPLDWRHLILRFPHRVMVGSDPVWNVRRTQSWDEADAGWDHLGQLIEYHRQWLKQLPADIEKKLRLDNAIVFFKIKS